MSDTSPIDASYDAWADFSQIYLEDSFVLDVRITAYTVELLVELVLLEQHPLYNTPKSGEQHSYRRGRIIFPSATDVHWQHRKVRQYRDPDGELDFGNIDTFVLRSGTYFMTGDWGNLRITSDQPHVVFL